MASHTLHVLRYGHRLVTAGQQQTLFLNCQNTVQKSTTSLSSDFHPSCISDKYLIWPRVQTQLTLTEVLHEFLQSLSPSAVILPYNRSCLQPLTAFKIQYSFISHCLQLQNSYCLVQYNFLYMNPFPYDLFCHHHLPISLSCYKNIPHKIPCVCHVSHTLYCLNYAVLEIYNFIT